MPKRQKKNAMRTGRLKIGVVGIGMVGTPLVRWFSEHKGYRRGKDLFLYDTNPTLAYFDDVNKADLIFVCVPTPPNPDGTCNTSIVEAVVGQLADDKLIALKSTIPPGTTWRLQRKHPKKLFLFHPEFLTESQAWADFIRPSRQIIGVTSKTVASAIELLNLLPTAPFSRPWAPIYGVQTMVNTTEAEMAKYMSNVLGAVKVWFANMAANACWTLNRLNQLETDGAPTAEYAGVRDMVGADQRHGSAWMDVDHGAYAGFGGFCFPKDFAAFKAEYELWTKRLELLVNMRSKGGTEADKAMVKVLKRDLTALKAIWDANESLLKAQNLTIEDVSYHDADIVLKKRRPIREL